MRYTAMIVGFLLATLTTVGAAEPSQSDYVEFTVHDLARTKTFYSAVIGWTVADYGSTTARFDDGKTGGGFVTACMPLPGGFVTLIALEVTSLEAGAAGGSAPWRGGEHRWSGIRLLGRLLRRINHNPERSKA